ncbi:MAG: 3-oxoacyl-ACP reductase FabG [Thaumarchaeota archaeon]|nr:3-oxoacyl-ACP reductase FabG [Nitrososphaerota archaeon]
MLLKDKVAIITGGARGLGEVYCHRFAEEGAKVMVADINGEGAIKVAEAIRKSGGNATPFKVDVSKEQDTKSMAETCAKMYGRIDILVNNAAIFYGLKYTPFDQLSSEEWDRILSVNVKGVWLCVKAVAPHMKQQGGGRIINVASGAPLKGNPGLLHYNASKAAVIGITRTLAKELGKHWINVNAVAPGFTLTEASMLMAGEDRMNQAVAARCLPKQEETEDVVGTVVFLASDMSKFITGQTLAVNGGDLFL